MRYMSKPREIDAEQFVDVFNPPRGVKTRESAGTRYHVVETIQGRFVSVYPGEWIVDEGDGEHFYPIKDDVFRDRYEAV